MLKEGGLSHWVDVPDVGHTTLDVDDLYGQPDMVKETHRFRVVGVVPDPTGGMVGSSLVSPTPRILLDMVTKYFVFSEAEAWRYICIIVSIVS